MRKKVEEVMKMRKMTSARRRQDVLQKHNQDTAHKSTIIMLVSKPLSELVKSPRRCQKSWKCH